MELLALVLLIPNTANFRHARTSRLKVHPDWVWTIHCLLRVRSLGGNLELRRVTDGFTPFLFIEMITYTLTSLIITNGDFFLREGK